MISGNKCCYLALTVSFTRLVRQAELEIGYGDDIDRAKKLMLEALSNLDYEIKIFINTGPLLNLSLSRLQNAIA